MLIRYPIVGRPADEEKESTAQKYTDCSSHSSSAHNVAEAITGDFVSLVLLFLHIFGSISYFQSGRR